ncbi:MAG TPA: GNAT family N-acetyltransferase [Jiangellaceae bacterium]|nr:GNAT family N-acetyltransferase [Jiangellaceae bacterium]
MSDEINVVRVGPRDWAAWRDLRLRALLDAPAAYGSTYESQLSRTEQQWRDRLDPSKGLSCISMLDDRAVGMAAGHPEGDGLVGLISMWVSPEARGRGVGDGLVDEVVRWAGEQHAEAVELWVTIGNERAERLYARNGFVRTGATQPLPSDPAVDEIAMRLSLSGPGSSAPGPA